MKETSNKFRRREFLGIAGATAVTATGCLIANPEDFQKPSTVPTSAPTATQAY